MTSIKNRFHGRPTFKNRATCKVPFAAYVSRGHFCNDNIKEIAYDLSPYCMRQHQLQDLFGGKSYSSLTNSSHPCELKIRCDPYEYESCYEYIINGRIVRDYGYY